MEEKNTSSFFYVDESKLFAIGDSNWDLYVQTVYPEQPKRTYLCAIAKEEGANNSCFGDLSHVVRLIRENHFGDEFTDYGRRLMEEAGYGDIVKEYERPKRWQIQYYDTYATYGTCLRTEEIVTNCYPKAKAIAYEMQQENEHCNYVLELPEALIAKEVA